MRWLWLASVGLISACGSSAAPGSPCSPRLNTPPPPPPLVTLEARAVTVSLEFTPVIACAGGNPLATAVETQVLNPRQQPVPHSTSAPQSGGTQGYSTTVTFTPETPGLYSLSARFEPGLGVARREVLAVADRTASAPAGTFHPPGPCDEVSALGPWAVCASAARGLELFRDGGLEAVLPAELSALTAHAAWTLADGGVTRWAVDGDALVSASLEGVAFPGAGLAHAATDDGWRAVEGARFVEVAVDGGALLLAQAAALPVAASGRSGLLVVDGPAVAFDALAVDGGPLRDDGDGGVRTVCRVPLAADDAGVVCHALKLELGARQGDALWLRSLEAKRVGLLRYLGGQPPPSVTFLAAQPVALVDQGEPLPFFTWSTFTVVVRPKDFVLEAFAPPAGRVKTGASATHVWFVTSEGQVTVHRR